VVDVFPNQLAGLVMAKEDKDHLDSFVEPAVLTHEGGVFFGIMRLLVGIRANVNANKTRTAMILEKSLFRVRSWKFHRARRLPFIDP
jgi:hypothetical protein